MTLEQDLEQAKEALYKHIEDVPTVDECVAHGAVDVDAAAGARLGSQVEIACLLSV